MKLYLLEQDAVRGYDTYDSCVVCAKNEQEASIFHPSGGTLPEKQEWSSTWPTKPEHVTATELGTANRNTKEGVILASFNAG